MEQPAALVLEAGSGTYRNQGDQLNLPLREGQFLFAGDTVAAKDPVLLLRCTPAGAGYRMRLREGSLTFGGGQDDESQATIQGRTPVNECAFPLVEKWPAAAAGEFKGKRSAEPPSAERTPEQLQALVNDASRKERQGDIAGALQNYRRIAETWTDQDWARRIVYRLESTAATTAGAGKLYALVLGVSRYAEPVPKPGKQLKPIPPLNFAHADAELIDSFLRKSQRATALGGAPEIQFLPNEKATFGTVRVLLNEFFNRAGKNDSVALFVASHGIAYNEDGFIVLYDSNLEELSGTAISMTAIRDALARQAARVRRVFLFVDACHAQRIGPIRDFSKVNEQLRAAAGSIRQGQVFALFASSGHESAYEDRRFGGGHGAFTYFLMRAFNTEGGTEVDRNGTGDLSPEEIVEYVAASVKETTKVRQRPQEGSLPSEPFRVSLKLTPLPLPCCNPLEKNLKPALERSRDTMDSADTARSVILDDPALNRRIALENEIHQLIQKYISGDEMAPRREDFAQGIKLSQEARQLAGESIFLEAREEFFRGRTAIFDKCYADAEWHLYRAARLDPASPYAHNALGIAFLEQAKYDLAEDAFQDAIRRAPYWAYPRHNLALAYTQVGDYARAIAAYREAMRLVPQYSYLPYNLGLLYQRLNRDDDAEELYRLARQNAPSRPAPLIALGALKTQQGQRSRATRYFADAEEALKGESTPELQLTLRHNQGILFSGQRDKRDQALALWRRNVEEAGYLPSRFELARTLSLRAPNDSAAFSEASTQWSAILTEVPDHTAARIAYSEMLAQAGKPDLARQVLQEGLDRQPDAASLRMRLQKLEKPR
jgi:tetratricopeptide (TPR) repeat protein